MSEKTYSVTLSDGTILDGLRLNGNNFISYAPVSADSFLDNCSPVIISDGANSERHDHMELVQITSGNTDEFWFVLRDVTESELEREKMQADVEYIAMMTGIEL